MKITAFILALITTILSVMPALEALSGDHCEDAVCCSGEQNMPETPQHDNGCNGELCNPFEVCGTCSLVYTDLFDYEISNTVVSPEVSNFYIGYFSPFYSSDCWQPPKQA